MKDAHAPGETVLSEPQRLYVEGWLRVAGDRLGLREWRITASAYGAKDDAYASTFIRDRADVAEIAVCRDFPTWDPDEQKATLVHELLHPVFHRVRQLANELVENELGRRTEAVIEAAIGFQEELAIERLARAIAPLFYDVELPAEPAKGDQP